MKGQMLYGIGSVLWGGKLARSGWDEVGVCFVVVPIWRTVRWNQVSWVRDAIE